MLPGLPLCACKSMRQITRIRKICKLKVSPLLHFCANQYVELVILLIFFGVISIEMQFKKRCKCRFDASLEGNTMKRKYNQYHVDVTHYYVNFDYLHI